jgi:hypothetical protein
LVYFLLTIVMSTLLFDKPIYLSLKCFTKYIKFLKRPVLTKSFWDDKDTHPSFINNNSALISNGSINTRQSLPARA